MDEMITVVDMEYAWTSLGKQTDPAKIYCAWCKKSQAEIKKTEDLNQHIENHGKEGDGRGN